MRIASVIMSLAPGGAEILVRNLSQEFVARGHEAHIIAITNAASVGNSPAFEEDFKAELAKQGISFEVVGTGRRRNPLSGAFKLRRALKAFRPDVVHVHTGYGLMLQAAGLVRLPTLYTFHNAKLNFPPRLFRLFDRVVDRYVAICAACEAVMAPHARKPIEVIFNGVPGEFASERPRQAPADEPMVLGVGALRPQKDYPTFIRAAAHCVREYAKDGRQIRFEIAGGGPCHEELQREIDASGVDDQIRLLGTRSDIAELMGRADLLVNSSLYEGLPITLIEAAMRGLPAVATDVGGNGEVVIDGRSGLLAPPDQPEALARAIVEALGDADRYSAFSRAALAHSSRFSLASCAEAHLQLYARVAQEAAEKGGAPVSAGPQG